MAEEKKDTKKETETKKQDAPKAEKKATPKKKKVSDDGMTVGELKLELQKVTLLVRSGEERDTSKVKKIKKAIAKKLTAEKVIRA